MVIITAIATKSRHTWSKFHLLNSNKLIFSFIADKNVFYFAKYFVKGLRGRTKKFIKYSWLISGFQWVIKHWDDQLVIWSQTWSLEVAQKYDKTLNRWQRRKFKFWPDPCTASFLTYNALNLGQFLCKKCPHDHLLLRTWSTWLQSLIYMYMFMVTLNPEKFSLWGHKRK